MSVPYRPEGFQSVTPYLIVADCRSLVAFCQTVLSASVRDLVEGPDGAIGHAELMVDGSMIMAGQARGEWTPLPGSVYVYLPDVDAAYARALELGAESVHAPSDQFYGDRSAGVRDSNGVTWWLSTHIEDVAPDELARRAAQAHA